MTTRGVGNHSAVKGSEMITGMSPILTVRGAWGCAGEPAALSMLQVGRKAGLGPKIDGTGGK